MGKNQSCQILHTSCFALTPMQPLLTSSSVVWWLLLLLGLIATWTWKQSCLERGSPLLSSRTKAGDGCWCELWPKQRLACSTTGDEAA